MDKELKRMNASEQEALLHLNVAYVAIRKARSNLNIRMGRIPGVNAMCGGAEGGVKRAIQHLKNTMPEEQRRAYDRNCSTMMYSIKVTPATRVLEDDGYWVSVKAMDTLLGAAAEACLICTKDLQEQRKCPLAKAFNEIPIAKGDANASGCGYFTGI